MLNVLFCKRLSRRRRYLLSNEPLSMRRQPPPPTANKSLSKRSSWDKIDNPPLLPRLRPRPLTPIPLGRNDSHATAQSTFFQRLPAELRRIILEDAFGNLTLHMHFEYNYPPIAGEYWRLYPTHANVPIFHTLNAKPQLARDYHGRQVWWFWGCVCHRNPPKGSAHVHGWPADVAPWRDECLNGGNGYCDLWPGKQPHKCRIGIMGWLRSCRQAYAEGIDVLYSTNKMHISSPELIRYAPSLLVPQSRSAIRSIELVWRLKLVRYPQDRTDRGAINTPCHHPEANALQWLALWLQQAFPNLSELYIALEDYMQWTPTAEWYPWESIRDRDYEELYLTSVDELVQSLVPSIRDCHIALSQNLFKELRKRATTAGATVDDGKVTCKGRGFWRNLGEESAIKGYWIREGRFEDIALLW